MASTAVTQSYPSREPLRVTGEITDWQWHSAELLKAMKDHLERLRQLGIEAIDQSLPASHPSWPILSDERLIRSRLDNSGNSADRKPGAILGAA